MTTDELKDSNYVDNFIEAGAENNVSWNQNSLDCEFLADLDLADLNLDPTNLFNRVDSQEIIYNKTKIKPPKIVGKYIFGDILGEGKINFQLLLDLFFSDGFCF